MCVLGDLNGKEGKSIGATYMIKVEEEQEDPFPKEDPFSETCEKQKDELSGKLDKCHDILDAALGKSFCGVGKWGHGF